MNIGLVAHDSKKKLMQNLKKITQQQTQSKNLSKKSVRLHILMNQKKRLMQLEKLMKL